MGVRQKNREREMLSISRAAVMRSAIGGCFIAALSVVSVTGWDQDAARDGPMDELFSPSCRIGSLQSWQGQPCVINEWGLGQNNDG